MPKALKDMYLLFGKGRKYFGENQTIFYRTDCYGEKAEETLLKYAKYCKTAHP